MMSRIHIYSVFLLLLSGCSHLSIMQNEQGVQTDDLMVLRELQDFSGKFAQKEASERVTACAALFHKEQSDNKLLRELKLAYAIAITPGCGSSSEALSLLKTAKERVTNVRLMSAIEYQALLLERLRGVSRYALKLKSRANQSQEKATALELKLEAIKSIEKALYKRD